MSELPTGTVTFLFTDLENSTKLWEQFPEPMRAALGRHDSLLRQAIEQCGGHIIKARGDGFHAAFGRAPDALNAALAAQRAIVAEPWATVGPLRVRIALHSGAGEERDGDYFGPALNRAARLLGVTHGGQVLLSAATAQLVQDDLPPDVELRDLGAWRFRDLVRPENVFQVVAPDLPTEFPTSPRIDGSLNNLPEQTTSFIGREQVLLEAEQHLEKAHLLTLVGTGGVGKTRLALEIATRQTTSYVDGVWLVELAPIADPDLVPQSVASVLDVPERVGLPVLTVLLSWLRPKHLLLVLDNCEHLVESCARLADAITRACPNVHLLATSREALGVAGEVRWPVPPMAVPDADCGTAADRLLDCECVQLFADRARLVSTGFAVDDQTAATIARICSQLDGIPLAIELAAARIRMLTPDQILDRLSDRFRLLKSDHRTAIPRQQTLQALVDWSYDLLVDQERRLFDRLAVFAGGFTLDAAEAIAAGDGIESADLLDLLTQLAEKSLVIVEDRSGERRFRLLVTLRNYAASRLARRGEEQAVRLRHLQFFLALAEDAAPRLLSSDHRTWRDRLEAEHEELRTALDWGYTQAPLLALRLGAALWRFWWIGGYQGEGQSRLGRLLGTANEDVPDSVRLQALYALGNLAFRNGDYESAQASLAEVRTEAERLDDRALLADALGDLGRLAIDALEVDEASRLLSASLALAEENGLVDRVAWNYAHLGYLNLVGPDPATAAGLVQRSLAAFENIDDQYGIASCRFYLAVVDLLGADVGSARLQLFESLRRCWEYQFVWPVPLILEAYGVLAVLTRRPERALRLDGAAAGLRDTYGVKPVAAWRQAYRQYVDPARAALGEALSAAMVLEGRGMSFEQAVLYALEDAPASIATGPDATPPGPPPATSASRG